MTTEDFPLLYYLFIGPPWLAGAFAFFLHFHGFIHEQQTASRALPQNILTDLTGIWQYVTKKPVALFGLQNGNTVFMLIFSRKT